MREVGGQVIATLTYTGTPGTPVYYHNDYHGSPMAATQGGKVTAKYAYGPFGEHSAAAGTPMQFTGQRYDYETPIYYLHARTYDPAQSRFFSFDPIGLTGGNNLYTYAGNDPINHTDPTGHAPMPGGYGGPPSGSYVRNLNYNASTTYGCSKSWCDGTNNIPYIVATLSGGAVSTDPHVNTQQQPAGSPYSPSMTALMAGMQTGSSDDPSGQVKTTSTVQFGGTVSVTGAGLTGTLNVSVARDSDGHLAVTVTYGGGPAVGAGLSGGVTVSTSDAKNVQDLGGIFGGVSVSGNLGVGGSVESFGGPSSDGQVTGHSLTIGGGFGAGASFGITNTNVAPLN